MFSFLVLEIEKEEAEASNKPVVLVKNNYMKPDPDAPPKRGLGRPPKPKTDSVPAASTVVSPPRPRGRPPKLRDPFAPPAPPKPKKSSSGTGSGKPRGRAPKKAKVSPSPSAPAPSLAAAAPATVPTSKSPRGRGRPPKVKAPGSTSGSLIKREKLMKSREII